MAIKDCTGELAAVDWRRLARHRDVRIQSHCHDAVLFDDSADDSLGNSRGVSQCDLIAARSNWSNAVDLKRVHSSLLVACAELLVRATPNGV
jgi:hypothetical protein